MAEMFIPIKDHPEKWQDVKFEQMYDDESDPKICKIEYSEDCKSYKYR